MRKFSILYLKEFQHIPKSNKDDSDKCLMDLKLSN